GGSGGGWWAGSKGAGARVLGAGSRMRGGPPGGAPGPATSPLTPASEMYRSATRPVDSESRAATAPALSARDRAPPAPTCAAITWRTPLLVPITRNPPTSEVATPRGPVSILTPSWVVVRGCPV